MGYYSEVRCIIYGEPDDVLRFVTAQKLTRPKIFLHLGAYITEYKVDSGEKGTAVLDLNISHGIKWYDDFEEVREWMAMLHDLDVDDDGNPNIQYEFIRVGEEVQDIEAHHSSQSEGWIYVRTIINSDLPHKVKEITDGELNETSEG